MPEPTQAMNDYMKSTFQLDPVAYPPPAHVKSGDAHAKKPHEETLKPHEGQQERGKHEGAEEPEEEGIDFSHAFPIASKKLHVAGGRLEIVMALQIQVSCKVVGGTAGESHADPKETAKAIGRFLIGWTDQTALPALAGGGGLFKSLKVERDGIGLKASAETETLIGHFALEFVLVKIAIGAEAGHKPGATLTLKAAEASATLMPHRVELPEVVLDGIKVTKLAIEAGGSIALAPNWPIVLGKWAAQTAGEDAAVEAGEVAAAAVGIDALIAGSAVAVGLAVIFGTLYSLAQGSKIGDLATSVQPGIVQAKQGFKLAMQGYKAPTNPLGAAGWQAGHQNRDALVKKVQKQFPDELESHIQEKIAGIAEEATKQAEETITRAVRTGLWDGYLADNKTVLLHGDAEWAYVACFGNSPKDGDPEWKKYLDQHKYGQKI